jgi:ketosteroid isomerase-like protein
MDDEFRDRIHEIYNAYLEGHFQYLVDEVVHDDIEFVCEASAHPFPYFARGKGKDALLAAWKASRADYEFLSYAPFLVVAESDDTAVIVVKLRTKALATDRVMELIVADRLRFRDDRVVEFRQFIDPCDATELWLTRESTESTRSDELRT